MQKLVIHTYKEIPSILACQESKIQYKLQNKVNSSNAQHKNEYKCDLHILQKKDFFFQYREMDIKNKSQDEKKDLKSSSN